MIALIDYGAGNLTSVKKALTHLEAAFTVPTSPEALSGCSGIIVPGVGNFEATANLGNGWTSAVGGHVHRGIPSLGSVSDSSGSSKEARKPHRFRGSVRSRGHVAIFRAATAPHN